MTSRFFGQVEVDTERCSACLICASFCPSGALTGKHDEETDISTIDFYTGNCIQCRLCQDVCIHEALIVKDAVPVASLRLESPVRLLEKQPPKKKLFGSSTGLTENSI
ncbi:MAG: 4Fe-4S binding protein [Coriobacteriia bacterium]